VPEICAILSRTLPDTENTTAGANAVITPVKVSKTSALSIRKQQADYWRITDAYKQLMKSAIVRQHT